nr:MAG TPA: hypothetical protein [Caudoviricetes sp.]
MDFDIRKEKWGDDEQYLTGNLLKIEHQNSKNY